MISFDIDRRYADDATVGSAMSRREGILISVVVHAALLATVSLLPQLAFIQDLLPAPEPVAAVPEPEPEEREAAPRFVYVEPPVETPAPEPPPVAELSDLDRVAADPEMAALPDNPLPFSLGNSSERVVAPPEEQAARGAPVEPVREPEPEATLASREPLAGNGLEFSPAGPTPPSGRDLLGDALRNLERYTQGQVFNNPQGGADQPGSSIQFDTRGVDFGPWLRRFIRELYRNWFVPQAALTFRGIVVLQFNIHKDGHITDIVVVRPSNLDGFNRAAYNAVSASSPLDPLPPEYPLDPALFTVTFYYGDPDSF